jgi:DNA-binding GntR family transcriptional regulator
VQACKAHAKRGDADAGGYYQLNMAFHAAVAKAAGNPFLTEMIKTNARKLLACYRVRYRYTGSIAAAAREDRQLAGLITSHDTAGAEALMQRHVQFDQETAMDLWAALARHSKNAKVCRAVTSVSAKLRKVSIALAMTGAGRVWAKCPTSPKMKPCVISG